MSCIKTGARVYLVEYNQTLPADIHRVADAYVIRMNMANFDTAESQWSSEGATHQVRIGTNSYWNKSQGTLVVSVQNLTGVLI